MRAFLILSSLLAAVHSQITVGLNCTGDEDGGCQEVVCPGDSEPLAPGGGCQCSPARCHDPPPCPSGLRPFLKKKASLKPGDCCDIFECPPSSEGVDCKGIVCSEDEASEPCPSDSYRLPAVQRDGECCSRSQGCACLPTSCPRPYCHHPSQLTVLARGDGRPGSCCPIYQCTSHNGSNRTCLVNGKEVETGGKWSPNKCSECHCEKGLVMCASVSECPPLPDDCLEPHTPPDACCQVCTETPETLDNNIDEVNRRRRCMSSNGSYYEHGTSWKLDDCTNCTCYDGKQECHAAFCFQTCFNATIVKGECCPVCNGSSMLSLPQHCPSISNCSLKCKNGFVKDDSNCFICQCKEDECKLSCPEGYKRDDNGRQLCECNSHGKCLDVATCSRKCRHGYRVNPAGCEICKCCKPLENCNKICPHGFKINKSGCPTCSCQGAYDVSDSAVDMHCTPEQGERRDDGESWEDHCRQCYCSQGKEMCTLIICPKIDCPEPLVYSKNSCCPTCPGNKSISVGLGEEVCFGDGGSLKREGEEWTVGNCVRCRCLGAGRVVCMREECPPAPCLHPLKPPPDSCCPYCEPQSSPDPADKSCGVGREAGSQWRVSACKSCICIDGVSNCFDEYCNDVTCDTPVIVKNQCCPVCTDGWLKQTSGCRIDNTTFGVGTQVELEPCLRCTCLPGPFPSCTRIHCSTEEGSWWVKKLLYLCLVSFLVVCSCVGAGLAVRHYCARRRDRLKLGHQPAHAEYHQYKYVPTYEVKPSI